MLFYLFKHVLQYFVKTIMVIVVYFCDCIKKLRGELLFTLIFQRLGRRGGIMTKYVILHNHICFRKYLTINEIVDKLMELWLSVLDKYAPLKTQTYGSGNNNKPSFSKEFCCCIDRTKNAVTKSQEPKDWNHYRRLRNRVNNPVRKEREKYDDDTWLDNGDDMTGRRL